MDRIDAMRSFVQVVESASFTQAAAALRLHKATVSVQVADLEKHLGVRLLTRTTRTVVPTGEGQVFHRKAVELLAQLDAVESSMRGHSQGPQGLLKVEVPVSMGRLVVLPHLREFLERYPRIQLALGCTDHITDLVKAGIDCAVRAGDLPDSSLVSRRVCDVMFALYASPNYLARWGEPSHPDDLHQHQWVNYQPSRQSGTGSLVLRHGEQVVNLKLPARVHLSDSAAVLQAALGGVGVAQLSNFLAAAHVRDGSLVKVLPAWQGRVVPLALVSPTARYRTHRVRVFMEWVHELILHHMADA